MNSVPTQIGPYEITREIGRGGMGVVYLARDTKLDRDVAIKALPVELSKDADRLARFEREAKLLASLNHPNIATIYGLEEADGNQYLILEYVEGETLAERLDRGAIPISQALPIAKQIAEAIEAAHEKGVIHRDLKPANIKFTIEGEVKVLDFGLAKSVSTQIQTDTEIADSPTLVPAGNPTLPGVMLGTAGYLSPEQARGQSADKRTDIFSFGCVMYECLVGRMTFAGETATDMIAKILQRDPDFDALPDTTPPDLRRLMRRCLAKDPRDRLRDIGDARIVISEAIRDLETGTFESMTSAGPAPQRSRLVLAGLATGLVLGVLLTIGIVRQWPSQTDSDAGDTPGPVVRSVIDLPDAAPLALDTVSRLLFALSPDGTQLVYVGESDQGTRLFRRDMASFDAPVPMSGTEGALHPFFSPDGRWVGFITPDKLKKISVNGGDPQTLCDVRTAGRANWIDDDVIYFVAHDDTIIQRVSSSGGAVETVTDQLMWTVLSQILPNGRAALLTSTTRGISLDYGDIDLLDLETHKTTTLIENGYEARYIPTGHIVFARGGNLLAVGFDLERRQVTGEPVQVVKNVSMKSLHGRIQVAISDNGTLVYVPGGEQSRGKITMIDREGKEEVLPVESQIYGVMDLSPNDDRIAIQVADVNDYIWIYDFQRREGRKLRSGRNDGWPVWAPDGNSIAFRTKEPGQSSRIMSQRVDAQSEPRELFDQDIYATPYDWSSDGRVITIHNWPRPQIGFITLGETPEIQWVETPGVNQWGATFSPNGKWVAYVSDKTGRNEIWVRSYPDGSIVHQVSVDGADEPIWGRDCDELFFHYGNTWWAVTVTLEPELSWEPPRVVFETDFIFLPGPDYEISADGQRLFVIKRTEPQTRTKLHTITNWFDELKRLVPTEASP